MLLNESARNGYQIMQELEQRSGGAWHPSPGSVYPALQLLEDEGLVTQEVSPHGKSYALTDAGKKYVKDNAEELGTPWDAMSKAAGVHDPVDLVIEMRQLAGAVFQLNHNASPKMRDEAKKILQGARRALFGLLAEAGADGDE